MNIRKEFPDEATLKAYLQANIGSLTQSVKDSVGSLEAQYIEKLKLRNQGTKRIVGGVFIASVCFVLFDLNMYPADWIALVVILLLAVIAAAAALTWSGWKKIRGTSAVIAAFHSGLNDALYPLVYEIFGLSGERISQTKKDAGDDDTATKKARESMWKSSFRLAKISARLSTSPEKDSVLALLDHSELITESRNRVTVDDMVSATFNGRTLFLSELDVKHETGSGKNRRVKKIFHGYFVSFDLARELTGKTFVSTEGDKKGFGHQSFFSTKKNEGLEVTELEWNDFEKLLHVVTNNPVEARYILTPDFMLDLHTWWSQKKQNIRISFLGNRMYVLFPDKNIRIGRTIKKISEPETLEYLESISVPLLHVLHLVEDIEN